MMHPADPDVVRVSKSVGTSLPGSAAVLPSTNSVAEGKVMKESIDTGKRTG